MNSLTEIVAGLKKERDTLRSAQKQETKKKSWFGGGYTSTLKHTDGRPATTPIVEEEDPSPKLGDLKAVAPTSEKYSIVAHSKEGNCVLYDSSGESDLVATASADDTI